jgi:hypothetical protein
VTTDSVVFCYIVVLLKELFLWRKVLISSDTSPFRIEFPTVLSLMHYTGIYNILNHGNIYTEHVFEPGDGLVYATSHHLDLTHATGCKHPRLRHI